MMRLDPDIQHTLDRLVERLVQVYQPQKVILFGSLAYGEPTPDSDIDLLIIKETTESPLQRRVQVRRGVADPHRQWPFSPLVLTPAELQAHLAQNDPFYQEIVSRGKVCYVQS